MVAGVALAAAAVALVGQDPVWAQEVASDLADAADAVGDVQEVVQDVTEETDWFQPWVDFNAGLIAGFDDVVEEKLGVTGTFGFAIIGYTILIKTLTYPLNQSSLRSGALNQLLAPKMQFIQKKYKNDQETQNRMMMRLWDDTGINPISGCIPSLLQFPIFIGLYRAIVKLADKNPHAKEPFLWIPSLSGPVLSGNPSIDWLLNDKDAGGLGWDEAQKYCILPAILVVSQYATSKISTPQASQQGGPASVITAVIPLVIGFTALSSPAGLGLYWLINNLFTVGQTYIIRQELGKEFPEYQKMLDGSDKKEAEEKKKEKEAMLAERETDITGLGKGFMSAAALARAEQIKKEEMEMQMKEKEPAMATAKASSARPELSGAAKAAFEKRRAQKAKRRRR